MMVTMLPRAAMHVVYQFFVVLLVQHLHSDNNLSPFLFSTTTSLFAISAPLSNPILNDTTVHLAVPEYFDNKRHFRKFEKSVPEVLHGVPIITLKHKHPQCSISFKQRWSTSVGSSVYSTPVIFPSGQEGKKQIFLNTFYEFLEIIGQDGYKPWGWPLAFEGDTYLRAIRPDCSHAYISKCTYTYIHTYIHTYIKLIMFVGCILITLI